MASLLEFSFSMSNRRSLACHKSSFYFFHYISFTQISWQICNRSMKVPYFREKNFGCLERGQTKNQICRPTIKDILWRKGYCCIIIEHNKDDSLPCLDASEYQFTIIQETYIYILMMKFIDGVTAIFTKIYTYRYSYWCSYTRKGGGGLHLYL